MRCNILLLKRKLAVYFILICCVMYGLVATSGAILKWSMLNREGIETQSRDELLDQWGEPNDRQSNISNLIRIAAASQPRNSVVAIRIIEKELTPYECNVICGIQSLVLLELYGCRIPDGYTARMINGNPSLQMVVLDFSECDLQPISLIVKHRELYGISTFKSIIPEDEVLSIIAHGVSVFQNVYFRI